jgi:hypothetical protein
VVTAAGSLVNSRRLLLVGNAFEDAAVLLARAGTTAPARSARGEALEVYGQIGASWDARRAAASRQAPDNYVSLGSRDHRPAGSVRAGRVGRADLKNSAI